MRFINLLSIMLLLGLVSESAQAKKVDEPGETWLELEIVAQPHDPSVIGINYHAAPLPDYMGSLDRLLLLRALKPNGPFDTLCALSPRESLYFDRNLKPGTGYYYRVRVVGTGNIASTEILGAKTGSAKPNSLWLMPVLALLLLGLVSAIPARRRGQLAMA